MRLHKLILLASVVTAMAHAQTAPPKADSASPAVSTKAATNTAAAGKKSATPADRLDLELTVVTGNRELPKVLYIVPWKKSEIGELPAQPFNTLLDEVLAPVDRDVFKREVKYFHAVNGEHKPTGAQTPAVSGGTESGQEGKN
jgi:hypothetical protein